MKWYYKPIWVFIAVLAAGPFALPLVWLSPAFKKWAKIVLTAAIIITTLWFIKAAITIYRDVMKELAELQGLSQ